MRSLGANNAVAIVVATARANGTDEEAIAAIEKKRHGQAVARGKIGGTIGGVPSQHHSQVCELDLQSDGSSGCYVKCKIVDPANKYDFPLYVPQVAYESLGLKSVAPR
jgi:hypothetical protein